MFDNTKAIASMATGGMDTVREVGLPQDLAIINLIETGVLLPYGPTLEEIIAMKPTYDCAVCKVFRGAVDTPYFTGGLNYMQDLCGKYVNINLIEPTSWAIFDFTVMQLRYEKPAANRSWWVLPRKEIAESISAYRSEHGLQTTDHQMDIIMKWVDYRLDEMADADEYL